MCNNLKYRWPKKQEKKVKPNKIKDVVYKTGDWVYVRDEDSDPWIARIYFYTHPKKHKAPYAVCALASEGDLDMEFHPNLVYFKQIKPTGRTETEIDSCIERLPICTDAKDEVKKIIKLLREEKNER